MQETMSQKTSGILASALIGLIIISFMFTGYESMRGTPDTLAKVGSRKVMIREYQQEYERQVQFYSNYMFGGNPLTEEQIKTFGLRETTMKSLINRKLMIELADQIGTTSSPEEIGQKVKELEYFKTNGQFDIARYKAILANARITPSDFEQDLSDQIKVQNVQALVSTIPLSKSYNEDLIKFKSDVAKVNALQINRRDLTKFIEVSNPEISKFLGDPTSLERVKNLFGSRKKNLDVQEAVKASHILLTTQGGKVAPEELEKQAKALRAQLTTQNFAKMADQKTEDPSGKGKGGALDWFEQGQMVPDFEKVAFGQKPGTISEPVKTTYGYHIIYTEAYRAKKEAQFDEHKTTMAKEIIQGEKTKELDELVSRLTNEAKNMLSTASSKEVGEWAKKYNIIYAADSFINRLEGNAGPIQLKSADVQSVFSTNAEGKDGSNIMVGTDPLVVVVAKRQPLTDKDRENVKAKGNSAQDGEMATQMGRRLNQDLLKALEGKVKVKVYRDVLNS